VKQGSKLASGSTGSTGSPGYDVTSVAISLHEIVNVMTTDSQILVAGVEGKPVVASTYPEWVSDLMHAYPVHLSVYSALSYLFPQQVQVFYDEYLEHLPFSNLPALAVPTPLAFVAIFAIDLTHAVAFALHSLASVEGFVVMLAAVALGLNGRLQVKARRLCSFEH